jgi:CubicO group peptidase (beta-lactamase class C family)
MTSPRNTGLSEESLSRVVEFSRANHSAQLVVMQAGETIVNASFDPAPVDVFAVQKGLLSILIGIAEEKYLLEPCDAINHHLEPEWTNLSPWTEASLTIERLLAMTTGMDDELNELGTVGESWRYNNTAYNYLKKILSLHTGMTLNELSVEWLFDPLGMTETRWMDRSQLLPDGTPISGLTSTAFDLAKIGQLVLNNGNHKDTNIVPSHYLNQMTAPGSKENPAWGFCWWNNNQPHHRRPFSEHKIIEGTILPQAPTDLVAARGLLENGLYIVPSLQLVVARTALPRTSKERRERFEQPFWELLLDTR